MPPGKAMVRQHLSLLAIACCGSLVLCVATHTTDRGFVLPLLAIGYLAVAAVADLLRASVSNRLLYPAILLVMLLYAVAECSQAASLNVVARWLAPADLHSAILGFGCLGGAGLLLFLIGAIGGADAKLAAFLGACVGLSAALHVVWIAALVGVAFGSANVLCRGWLTRQSQKLAARACARFGHASTLAEFGLFELPLALLILIGLLVHMVASGLR